MRTPRRITDNNARRVAEDLLKQIDVVDSKLKKVYLNDIFYARRD